MIKRSFKAIMLILSVFYALVMIVIYIIYASTREPLAINIILLIWLFSYILSLIIIFFLYVRHLKHFDSYEKKLNINGILYNLLLESINVRDKGELFNRIIQYAVDAMPHADKGTIMLLNEDKKNLHFIAATGHDFEVLSNCTMPLSVSFPYLMSGERVLTPIILNDPNSFDYSSIPYYNQLNPAIIAGIKDVHSIISAPIIYDNELYGIINIESTKVNAFNQTDIETMELFVLEVVNVIRNYINFTQMDYILHHDQLTGCLKAEAFDNILKDLTKNTFNGAYFILIHMTLINLEHINKAFGYESGDKILMDFGETLQKYFPSKSYISRYSGNEFSIIVPEESPREILTLCKEIEKKAAHISDHTKDLNVHIKLDYTLRLFPKNIQIHPN